MRSLDVAVNVNLLLIRIGSIHRFLIQKTGVVAATGGTNWKEFLPPIFHRISFFSELWSEKEMRNWEKNWVDELFNKKTPEKN